MERAASVLVDLTPPADPTGLTTASTRVNAPQPHGRGIRRWTPLPTRSSLTEAPLSTWATPEHTRRSTWARAPHSACQGAGRPGQRERLDCRSQRRGGLDRARAPAGARDHEPHAGTIQMDVGRPDRQGSVHLRGQGRRRNGGDRRHKHHLSTALADGEHFLQVRTKDDLGNVSAWSEKGWVVVDTIAPAAPVITLVTPSPTNEPLQEWSWTRTAVDIVRFQFGESTNGVAEPTSYLLDGDVDNAVTNFTTDGAHHVMVRAIDAVGNVGAWSAPASVLVDLTPPGVPKNLKVQTPTRNNTPEWTWDAADNPDGDLAGYELLLDEAVVIDVGDVLSYTHSEMLSDGMHTMRARSYDRLGNSSAWTDPATSVLVDATPPEAPGMPRAESPTANRRPTWTWNATSGAVTYRVFLDGVAQQPVDTESNPNGIPQPGTTFTPAADLADGRHDLQVTAIDALGNESAKSAAGSVLVDGTAPAVPDIAHLPTYTKATQVVFRWSSIGDVAGYNFSYSLGDSDTWTTLEGITKQSYVVNDPDDGVSVKGRVGHMTALGILPVGQILCRPLWT